MRFNPTGALDPCLSARPASTPFDQRSRTCPLPSLEVSSFSGSLGRSPVSTDMARVRSQPWWVARWEAFRASSCRYRPARCSSRPSLPGQFCSSAWESGCPESPSNLAQRRPPRICGRDLTGPYEWAPITSTVAHARHCVQIRSSRRRGRGRLQAGQRPVMMKRWPVGRKPCSAAMDSRSRRISSLRNSRIVLHSVQCMWSCEG